MKKMIRVQGARVHNLKNVTVQIPRDQLIVFTGISGSGKSSLAFDTLYAEGQRRYALSLSTYARQFIGISDKPDVDCIDGLSPAIAVEQKSISANPRSTVGTVTDIQDYLRLLFSRASVSFCPVHHIALRALTPQQMMDEMRICQYDDQHAWLVLAPTSGAWGGSFACHTVEEFDRFLQFLLLSGFVRIALRKVIYEIDYENRSFLHEKFQSICATDQSHCEIDVVVDRLRICDAHERRLLESIECAIGLSGGRVCFSNVATKHNIVLTSVLCCPMCSYTQGTLDPGIFSFQNPRGACPTCSGLGELHYVDESRFIFSEDVSLAEGAIVGWGAQKMSHFHILQQLAQVYQVDIEKPYRRLPAFFKKAILWGTQDLLQKQPLSARKKGSAFSGVIAHTIGPGPYTKRPTRSQNRYWSSKVCPTCEGSRLQGSLQNILFHGHSITQLCCLSLQGLYAFFTAYEHTVQSHKVKISRAQVVACQIIHEIKTRLCFLLEIGLGYLSLSRSTQSLSGGEAQRIQLASQIGTGLTGILYVLDEPSIGLHVRDNHLLIKTLQCLRDIGNTVIVVEHDKEVILAADTIVDIGPGAGMGGGQIVAMGPPAQFMQDPRSITATYLRGDTLVAAANCTAARQHDSYVRIEGATGRTLKNVDVNFPVGVLTCVTGVSGSGKSTLVCDTLYQGLAKQLGYAVDYVAPHTRLLGANAFEQVIHVDQNPIRRAPRSNLATYMGVFALIRALFARTTQAVEHGYCARHFSFNTKGGRCEACEGEGVVRVNMLFMPDAYVSCDVCGGKRYAHETLSILYHGHNVHDVLQMTVREAKAFFVNMPLLCHKLAMLSQVGLDYLLLGQSVLTVSGGEAQRLKLAVELAKRITTPTLYVLDEPTTGLHFHDIRLLLSVLRTLCAAGHTVVVIEHNVDVIQTADWIIDMGPEGGEEGGYVLACGAPLDIIRNPRSVIGPYLKERFCDSASYL